MPFNFDLVPSRRQPGVVNRWTMFPPGHISMAMADMDFPVAPQIQKALHKQVDHGVLGYDLMGKPMQDTISARMKNRYSWRVNPESIVYTVGVNNGYNIAARLLCNSKRGYLIQTPVYNEFRDTEHKVGVPQLTAPLVKKAEGNRIRYEVDFERFEKQVKKAGMFLLCNPHNPVGQIFSQKELLEMARICIENDVIIVSDEIHCELLLGNAKFQPLAKLSKEIAQHTITLTSASKAHNVAGLACAFAIIPNEKLRKQFDEISLGMSYEVSTPGLVAARVAYSGQADSWLGQLNRYLTANRDFVIEYVGKYLPGVKTTKPDATYLMWMDFSELKLKPSPYEFFLKNAKVVLSDGKNFGVESAQFARLNIGTSRKILKQALDRMRKALGVI